MKTAVGVFLSRARAEEAIRVLLKNKVPLERITFLSPSDPQAEGTGRDSQSGSNPQSGSNALASPGIVSIPGLGQVFAQGPDVQTLFAPAPSLTESTSAASPASNPSPATLTSGNEHDAAFFRRVLNDGCSVIVVRSDSNQIAASACEVLDKLSLGISKGPAVQSTVRVRQIPGAAVASFFGKLALDDGCRLLRETVRSLLDSGQSRILLNLEHLKFLDSAGLGELVRTQVAVRGRGGQLTLINPAPNVRQLLHLTKVDRIFDIAPDELTALNRTAKTGD